jgi:hypothetical protein
MLYAAPILYSLFLLCDQAQSLTISNKQGWTAPHASYTVYLLAYIRVLPICKYIRRGKLGKKIGREWRNGVEYTGYIHRRWNVTSRACVHTGCVRVEFLADWCWNLKGASPSPPKNIGGMGEKGWVRGLGVGWEVQYCRNRVRKGEIKLEWWGRRVKGGVEGVLCVYVYILREYWKQQSVYACV